MINKFLLVLLENRDSSSPFVICNCWLTDLQLEMVECKQQNCYIELIKSAKGEKMILADKITEERKKWMVTGRTSQSVGRIQTGSI